MTTRNGEIVEVERSIPFTIDPDLVDTEGGLNYLMLRWASCSTK